MRSLKANDKHPVQTGTQQELTSVSQQLRLIVAVEQNRGLLRPDASPPLFEERSAMLEFRQSVARRVDRFTDRLQVVQRLRVRLLFALQLHVSRFHRFGQFLRERANGWKNTSRVAARRAEEYASCSPYHYTESHARSQVLRLEGKKYILRGTAPDVPPWLRICRKIERDNTD